jgi:hypothetical protein
MKASILGEPRPQEGNSPKSGKIIPAPPEDKPETEAPGGVAQEVPEEAPARGEPSLEVARLIEEIVTDLKVVPIQSLLTARDEAASGVQRLEQSLSQFRDQRESLQAKLRAVIGESTEALARGEKTKDAEIRKIKVDLSEAEAWVDQLETVAIPQAMERAKATRKALAEGFSKAVREVHNKWEGRMRQAVMEAANLYDAWKAACQNHQKNADIRQGDFATLDHVILKLDLTNVAFREFLHLGLRGKRYL